MKTLTLHLLEFDRPYCFFFSPPNLISCTDELVLLRVIRRVYSDDWQEKQMSDRMEYPALSELTAFVSESNGVWRLRMCVWSG